MFFDEVDAIGGARFDDGLGGDNEVQRTMLEIVNQLDGFDARGNIKVLMATNRYRLLSWCTTFMEFGYVSQVEHCSPHIFTMLCQMGTVGLIHI